LLKKGHRKGGGETIIPCFEKGELNGGGRSSQGRREKKGVFAGGERGEGEIGGKEKAGWCKRGKEGKNG